MHGARLSSYRLLEVHINRSCDVVVPYLRAFLHTLPSEQLVLFCALRILPILPPLLLIPRRTYILS